MMEGASVNRSGYRSGKGAHIGGKGDYIYRKCINVDADLSYPPQSLMAVRLEPGVETQRCPFCNTTFLVIVVPLRPENASIER